MFCASFNVHVEHKCKLSNMHDAAWFVNFLTHQTSGGVSPPPVCSIVLCVRLRTCVCVWEAPRGPTEEAELYGSQGLERGLLL